MLYSRSFEKYNTHYLVFKELFLRNQMISQNQAKLVIKSDTGIIQILLRKEVIHPHVPVGIPCYDFTPVADPTFAGPLLKG